MARSTRRRIFYTLVALFVVIGGGVVGYAQGWRLNFVSWTIWRFEKIGGIYIRSYPESAAVYLNDKSVQNQSGFLSRGTLISDLLPRTYRVTLEVPGYETWREDAVVEPSLVVQFKYAVLVPASSTPIASSTAKQIALEVADANASAATTTDPYNQNQKLVVGKNKISLFDIAAATTTDIVTVSGKNIAARWISNSILGILQDNGELYLYHTDTQTLVKLADDVKNFAATDDGSMVAAVEYKSLEIFSLTDTSVYYRFNLPNTAAIEHVIWYHDKTHLFVVYPGSVSFLDLADTSLTNFTSVARGGKPFYDPQTNALYITSPENQLVQYDFPN